MSHISLPYKNARIIYLLNYFKIYDYIKKQTTC
jgi:hypothetical protein